jgi:polyisoprenoid-binding protein YceI
MLLLLALLGALPGAPAVKCESDARTLTLDLAQSTLRWRGTKFWGLGKHEGTVRFQGGGFCVRGGQVLSGWFEVDLRTIEVTDIPAHDPEPRNNLRNHLLGPDFFEVSRHPVARFILRSVREEKPRLYQVEGDLTIRGTTHPIRFYARGWSVSQDGLRAEARMEIERHKYGVSYRGSTLRDDLVDDTFWLEVALEARPGP